VAPMASGGDLAQSHRWKRTRTGTCSFRVRARWGTCWLTSSKAKTKIKRVRADTLGYLQRSFLGCVSATDASRGA